MADYRLSELQQKMLRAIAPGLQDGSVEAHLLVGFQPPTLGGAINQPLIAVIRGMDESLWADFWDEITRSDFLDLTEQGFFRDEGSGNYSLRRERIIDAVNSYFGQSTQQSELPTPKSTPNPREVWVVHGRNIDVHDSMISLLRALDLRPISFDDAVRSTGKGAPYIHEILETALSQAQAVIVLITPDDLAYMHPTFQKTTDAEYEKRLTPQARPNVLFEAGMAMGLFRERTIIVEVGGNLRPFSDIHGRHIIKLDDSTGSRKRLVQRLASVQCPVDWDGEWNTAGKFSLPEVIVPENNWCKSAAVWWLCHDIEETLGRVSQKHGRGSILEGIARVHNHASEVGVDEAILNNIEAVRNEVLQATEDELKSTKKAMIERELRSIFNGIAELAKTKQIEMFGYFKGEPD